MLQKKKGKKINVLIMPDFYLHRESHVEYSK